MMHAGEVSKIKLHDLSVREGEWKRK